MRATANGVPITTRDCLAGASRRKASRLIRQASRRQNPTACNLQRSTSHSRTLAHALPPLPPTFDSSTDPARQQICRLAPHYCCKPRLPKVRLSIRGALNPYILPPLAPDIVPRCTALHRALTPWPRLPGCRRIAASVCQVLDCQNPVLPQCWHLCLPMACCFPKPNTGCGN
jgi:hypothetical protein